MGEPAKKFEPNGGPKLQVIETDKKAAKAEAEELKRLRDFGILMATVFTALSALLLWRHRPTAMIFLPLAVLFLAPAYIAPRSLGLIEKLWLGFGEKMSMVMTTILLVATYFVVMTPVGILLRLMGKDLLDIKLDPAAKTYWKPVDPEGPHTRPYLPY